MKWIPHYAEAEPCTLTCRGRPVQPLHDSAAAIGDLQSQSISPVEDDDVIVVQLAPKVQDGTRCRPGSLDMCINAKCEVSTNRFKLPRLYLKNGNKTNNRFFW